MPSSTGSDSTSATMGSSSHLDAFHANGDMFSEDGKFFITTPHRFLCLRRR